ncbi:cytochrome c oxidase, subunit VIA [Anopheles darlingi]|uniref:Cytochrome c oxidase, subunit VIA n=3 Tax=Nyssorhynchus TaxID=44543 RepID=W5JT15_ANODA|nr:cytochrome c oxidase subunit 6A, mitochondrial [Anopheles darlingi]ETN66413.1 cytochrome c oxidase, subunit VIA [Anopheles darlingi]
MTVSRPKRNRTAFSAFYRFFYYSLSIEHFANLHPESTIMSLVSHILRRSISQSIAKQAQVGGPSAVAGHEAGGYKVWKKLSFFVAMPAVGLCMLNAYLKHQEEHGHPRPEFVKYEHLRIRNKRFPWGEGNKSLFHNPHTNPLPDGYEH